MQRKILVIFLGSLVALAGLVCVGVALLPYGTLKGLADSLMRDGNFKSLNEANAYVFRVLLGLVGLALDGLASVIGLGRTRQVRTWFGHYIADVVFFIRSLKPASIESKSLAVLLLILCLGFLFRLVHINDVMTHDESYTYVVFSSTSFFNVITNYHLPNNHVLNSLLILISTRLFGIQPWAVRLPALIAGMLIIPVTFGLAQRLYDRNTALASALLVAILPGAIYYSTTGRGYSLVALFTVLTLWLAIYLRESKNRFAWTLLILFSALGFYSVPVMLLPFGVVFAWLFFENLVADTGSYGSKTNFLKYWLVAGVGTLVLVLLLYAPIFIFSGADKVFANPWVLPESWAGYISSLPGRILGIWSEWTTGLPPVLTGLLLVGFALGLILQPRITRKRFPLQLAAFLWLAALLLVQRPQGVTKIWGFLQAPFMIWCAAGIVGSLKDWPLRFARNVSAATVVVGIALLLTVVYAVQVLPTIPQRWDEKGPAERTVLFIRDQLGHQDLIIIDAPFDAAVWYYSDLYGIGGDSRFDKLRLFDHLFVVVSHTDGQTLESVIQARGPDPNLVDIGAARIIMNYQNLDIYVVPHH